MDGIVVAFRGTQGASPLDWLQNAAILLVHVLSQDIPGRVHLGFFKAVQGLYQPLQAALLELLEEYPVGHLPKIYLAGHSKGGCLASLTAVLMAKDDDLPPSEYVCTFGAARLGNALFVTYFNEAVRQTSYENDLDIIPFLPPGKGTMDAMDENMTNVINE